MIHTIKAIEPNVDNYSIKIIYSDDVAIIVGFKALLEKGVMQLLKNPIVFKQVHTAIKSVLIWQAQDIDFCADSLRLKFYQLGKKSIEPL